MHDGINPCTLFQSPIHGSPTLTARTRILGTELVSIPYTRVTNQNFDPFDGYREISFNPLYTGHQRLLDFQREYSFISFNPYTRVTN